jgi:L-iditol 2-dehydrogenase
MRGAFLTGIRQMELREVPDPKIERSGDVLLKLGAVGICGSDVHYYATGRVGSQVVQFPFLLGHECSATVVDVGSSVKRLKPGDRVAVDPAASCGACDQCLGGRRHTCRALSFLGCPGQAEGCLSDLMVMPEDCCFPVAAGTSFEHAALAEPLSIAVYAAAFAAPAKNAAIGILGSGPIGLSVLLCARRAGEARIYVTDRIDNRLNVARAAGATWTGNPDTEDIVKTISEREPLLLDAVLECCGKQEAMDQAVEILKPGGKLVLVGIPEVDRISFCIDKLRRKEISIQNIRRQNECFQAAVDLIEQRGISVDFMVTHRFPLEETKEAFDLVESYRDGVVKAMIMF